MFTIIIVLGSIVAVCCQAPVALNPTFFSILQSDSYTGLGSSSATATASGSSQLYSGVGTLANSVSAVSSSGPDPNIEMFTRSLLHLLVTSPALNAVPGLVITDPYSAMHKAATFFLKKETTLNLNKPNLVEFAADGSRDIGAIPKNLLLNTVAHVMPKLLSFNNLLTQESTFIYPRIFVNFVEVYGLRDGIFDADSLLQALSNGLFDFLVFTGINNEPTINLTFQLYVKELKDLATGVEI